MYMYSNVGTRLTTTTIKYRLYSHAKILTAAPPKNSFLFQVGNIKIMDTKEANIPIITKEKEPSSRMRTRY